MANYGCQKLPFLPVTCQPVIFFNLTSINNRKKVSTSYIFEPHFDICITFLKPGENFMTICEIVNEMCEFENGKSHCNTNL